MNINGVSTQLYVWSQMKDAGSKSLDETLGEVAAAGYDGAETNLTITDNSEKIAQVRTILKKYSLKLSSLYTGGTYHERSAAETTIKEILKASAYASELGIPSITSNPASKGGGKEKTDDELKIQAENLNKLGEGLKKLGMSFYIHNHTPEIVSNAREFRSYCDLTNPEFVGVCIDVHWVLRGGVDPFALTKEYGNRIGAMHIRNSKDGIWTEDFNDGDIDYIAYRELMESINYNGWITVELAYEGKTKITRTLVENSKISREYVKKIFGV